MRQLFVPDDPLIWSRTTFHLSGPSEIRLERTCRCGRLSHGRCPAVSKFCDRSAVSVGPVRQSIGYRIAHLVAGNVTAGLWNCDVGWAYCMFTGQIAVCVECDCAATLREYGSRRFDEVTRGLAPPCLADEPHRITDARSRQRLHSASTAALIVTSPVNSTIGDRAFPVAAAAARIRNSLPQIVTSSPSLPVFRQRLETKCFTRSFHMDCR